MSSTSINPSTLEFIQKDNARRARQRKIAFAVGGLLVIGIATAGYFGIRAMRQNSQEAVAKELASKISAAGPGAGFEEMRKAVDSGQITREQAWAAGREAMEQRMQQEMTGFFNTPAKDRDKYLDKLIDEMQKMRAEWEARRAAEGPTTRPERRDRGEGPTTRPEGERRDRGPGGMGGGRGDNASPQQRAMRTEFMAAMMKRMQERGIEMRGRGMMGMGRGGPGGGGGGGR